MDKEESPAESNKSDSEDAAVDHEKALAEKAKVKTVQVLQKLRKTRVFLKAVPSFIFRVMNFSKWRSMTRPSSVTREG